MRPSDQTLDQLAGAVADGDAIDWAHAESSAATDAEREIIRQLRDLAGLGAAARAQATIWGALQIRGEVGSGAFGTVYRAWDPRLEREVALKLLHAGADQPGASTVIREGRLLAQIRHPNVVTVYGADQHDDRIGIWMEFVTGRTLKTIVSEQGPFGAPEAALIGRDLCRALAAVHKLGFVHRDVKAQNVMREAGGRTVLMDFGAGEAVGGAAASPLRGTPVYLAPELLEGSAPGVASDIYSLGVLLYFLVSGTFPVVGTTLDEFRERHAAGKRTLLRDVRPDRPDSFVRAVDGCRAARPELRPESAGAIDARLVEALHGEEETIRDDSLPARATQSTRRLMTYAAGVAVVLLLAAAAWVGIGRPSVNAPPATSRDSVAILPIRDLTGSADDDFLSEGITADLIASLSSLRDLRVIAGPSTRPYANRERTPVEIGRELGVATVLDASLRRAGDRVRIVTQLIDARSGEQLWSESFDREAGDIMAMKSDVANRIAVALRGELSQGDAERLGAGRQYDHQAFLLYLRGRHHWGLRNEESMNRAIQYFHDALGRDPGFAPAYAGLADAYAALGVYGSIPRDEAYTRAAAAAEKAVSLDDTLAEAHASLGLANKNRFQWQAAERSFKRAIELKPGYSTARLWYSVFLTQHGRFSEAIAEIKTAMSLDPLSVAPRLQFASLLMMARRFDDAVAQYDAAQSLDSTFATGYRHKAITMLHKRDYARAQALFEQARQLSPVGAEDQEMKADLGFLYAVSGRADEARAIAGDLIQRYERAGEGVAGSIAAIFAGLGARDEAIRWLERARDARDPEAGYLLVDPRWDSLRDDPRFRALLTSLGFAGTN